MTDATRPRTAAATDALRERGASTAAGELIARVGWLTDRDLVAVTERLIVECVDRGITLAVLEEEERRGLRH